MSLASLAGARIPHGRPGGGDPDFANVGYLLHFDDPGTPQIFTDVLPNTWTRGAFSGGTLADLQVSSVNPKWGPGSLQVTTVGGSSDFTLNGVPNGGSYLLQPGNLFTLEAWVWWTGNVDSRISGGAVLTGTAAIAEIRSFGANNFSFDTQLNATNNQSEAMPLNQWVHVAMSYDGTTKYWFIGGVLKGSAVVAAGSPVLITGYKNNGIASGNPSAPAGYVDDMRFTFDVCRYTADFTPPAGPFPDFA